MSTRVTGKVLNFTWNFLVERKVYEMFTKENFSTSGQQNKNREESDLRIVGQCPSGKLERN